MNKTKQRNSTNDPSANILRDEKKQPDFKNNYKFKGKKRSFSKGFKGKKTNDISWHNKNAQLLKDFASIPFNHIVGSNMKLSENMGVLVSNVKTSEPVILAIDVDHTFGGAAKSSSTPSDSSILNTCAKNLYTFLRGKISGNYDNYQSADAFINPIAAPLDILVNVQYCVRFFGMVNKWTDRNRTIPRAGFMAAGIDFDDFINNIALYRGRLNILIAQANAIKVPKQFPLYEQALSFFKDIYKDSDGDTGREQYIMFTKLVSHIYDPTGDTNGGCTRLLTVKDAGGSTATSLAAMRAPVGATTLVKFSALLNIITKQLNALVLDDDYNRIMADIKKAFGDSSAEYWGFTAISDDYVLDPVYSEEILRQLHNAVFNHIPIDSNIGTYTGIYPISGISISGDTTVYPRYVNKVGQYQNIVYNQVYINLATSEYDANRQITLDSNVRYMMDINVESPTPEENMINTRFMTKWVSADHAAGTDPVPFITENNPTVLMFNPRIVCCTAVGEAHPTLEVIECNAGTYQNGYTLVDVNNTTTLAARTQFQSLMSYFGLFPIYYLYQYTSSGGVTGFYPVGDMTNYRSVIPSDLSNIDEVSLMSLLNVPYDIHL